jgi:hypothetical protein
MRLRHASSDERKDALVDVERDERRVEQEGDPLARKQEHGREEGVGNHLGQDKLRGAGRVSL